MSVEFANRGIVRDGLIFSIDPYNTKSYVSGSTSIYGLTKDKPLGTLENGVTFDGGSLSLDGTNQNISINTGFSLNPPTLPLTMDFWVNVSTGSSSGCLLTLDVDGSIYYGVICNYGSNNQVILSVADGTGSGVGSRRTLLTPVDILPLDEWVHITCILRNPTSGFDMTCYVDLVSVGGTTSGTGGAIAWSSDPLARTFIGEAATSPQFTEMLVSQVNVYNKELSLDEIKQNHNAIKGRFLAWQ
jgi:hypothetical protein